MSFRILPARSLVYVRFEGRITVPEAAGAFGAYARDTAREPGHKHLLDMSRVTGWAADFPALIQFHARLLDGLFGAREEILCVYHAPPRLARPLVRIALQSWEEVPGVVALVQETEAGALDLLGQPERSFAALLQNA